jgi:hypothetical protein
MAMNLYVDNSQKKAEFKMDCGGNQASVGLLDSAPFHSGLTSFDVQQLSSRNRRPVEPAPGIGRRRIAEIQYGTSAIEICEIDPVYQVGGVLNVAAQVRG